MFDIHFPIYIFAFFLTMLVTIILEKRLIPVFKEKAKQPIYEEGPKWHMSKSGTPTMGGIAFVIAISLAILLSGIIISVSLSKESFISIVISLIYALANAGIGIIDDKEKLKKSKNKGLTAWQKLLLQSICALAFLLSRKLILNDSTVISFSFGDIDLGFLYYPLSMLILLGVVNCANLTDGIDGLASSVAFSIGISFLYITASIDTATGIFSSAIIGASIGFLVFNIHPAKIFMGDTGSLFFGSLIVTMAFMLNNPLLILFIGAVYIFEGISVILQVFVFKLTKKRLFMMAPIHHHFEKKGWSENKICIIAMITTFLMSIPAYVFYLP